MKSKYQDAIRTIAMTAAFNAAKKNERLEYILKVCERTAKAIQIEFGLNKKVMTDYRKFIKENSNSNSANTFYKSMTLQSAEQTKAVVYELCDNLDDPNEIMEHIRMSDELIFAWQPKRQDTD